MDDLTTDYETPASTGEAPAEFAMVANRPEFAPEASAPSAEPRRHPLRFMWQMDGEGRFLLGSDEFNRLIGARTAASFGRRWTEIADTFGIDPEGRVATAVATHTTWSGITVNWPVDGGERLAVELSGLPVYERGGTFAGYRGFGVCRDVEGLTRLAEVRRHELFSATSAPAPLSADIVQAGPAPDLSDETEPSSITHELTPSIVSDTSQPENLETTVETPKNVLPFRPIAEPKSPSLTAVESNAFDELARQLSARLDNGNATPAEEEMPSPASQAIEDEPVVSNTSELKESGAGQPEWLRRPETPARGETRRDKTLLDLLPIGILIYRLDRLLYANRAFLVHMGYDDLRALEEAGGLDALYVEPGVSAASSTSGTGTPVTISATPAAPDQAPPPPADAHLFTISWDGDSALALIFSSSRGEPEAVAATPAASPPPAGHANAEDLGAILDATSEGIVMFDAQGAISACNRSAEALFGYGGADLVKRNLAELVAPECRREVLDDFESIKRGAAASAPRSRETLGRIRDGAIVPLSVTIGRTQPDSPNYFAVFRDPSHDRKIDGDLLRARRLADRAANAKTDVLARVSHDVRTPLNAILGFADVMIQERFGALGNERYAEYMKDIRASGERVIAIVNDLHDLSRIESGTMDLAFTNHDLNSLVEQCVAAMQPQANRERIIIRTSLAHALPPVVADPRALRQILHNLIGNSIHLANAGGQVIVSTAISDFSEVTLRVRDTGHGLNDNEVAAALEPFRTQAPADQVSDGSGVALALTKALVEANRAKFHIKTGPQAGTLIEVVFSHAMTARV
jgi:PAS domain S-box-containing protein